MERERGEIKPVSLYKPSVGSTGLRPGFNPVSYPYICIGEGGWICGIRGWNAYLDKGTAWIR